jgi:hypothetical protein
VTNPIARRQFRFETERLRSTRLLPLADFVLVVVFMIDLLASYLIWQGYLPEALTSLSQVLTAGAIAFAYTRMMYFKRIPGAVWAILGIAIVGITVAVFRGQSFLPTLWGAWNFLKYPLVGIYAYLRLNWPKTFPELFTRFGVGLVVFEVVFQLAQYLTGEEIGDNLAGSFGWHGVGHIFFLTAFVLSIVMGNWVAQRRWLPVVLVLVLGIISNILAENKIFPVAALAMGSLAAVLLTVRSRQLWRLILSGVLVVAGTLGFTVGYNALKPEAERKPLQRLFIEEEARTDYLNKVKRSQTAERQTYNLGRNNALAYALSTIADDGVTLLFGLGLGARSSSSALGVTGTALRQDVFDRGSQLMVLLQELGLFGIFLLIAFTIWVSLALLRDIRRYPNSEALGLRYGLLLFSVLWPVWAWYKIPLGARVAMLLYWVALGYVFSEPYLDAEIVE